MVRHKAVLERYAALRCLWHAGVVALRSPSIHVAAPTPVRACVATLVRVSARRPRGARRAGAPVRPARAPGRAGGRLVRPQGEARCVRV
eukprot:2056338-Prymnesium_polylepis.1